ncbi:MAG TPA: thiamine-phosphate kinase, partial [Sutterella sp.]|nr:thiamine-phosphate kinase [Sutterella sp.]
TVALPEGAPLSISITAFGEPFARVTRAGAVSGDDIWVTGYLGLAGAALTLKKAGKAIPDALLERLIRPEARLALGQKIADRVSAACDVSDGFISDLNHILLASGVGARLDFASFPVHRELQNQEGELGTFGIERAILAGGDDYELVFCAAPQYREAFKALSTAAIPVTRVGVVTREPGLEILHLSAETQNALDSLKGYEHRVSLHA